MSDREKIVEIFSELRNFADNDVHPVVGPENWHVYSKLCDLIDQAEADALAILEEKDARELAMDEWREWKANKKRDPICILWEYDTSPIWILNPNDVHEPAFLMGKLKLFTGKPTFEQCKAVKWE